MVDHTLLSCASCVHRGWNFCRSSLHLVFGLPGRLLRPLGVQWVSLEVHLLSLSLAMCPAQFHLSVLTVCMMSLTPVLFLIHSDVLWSLHVMFNMILSWALCIDLSLIVCFWVRFHVSAPYVTVGSIHWLYTCLLRTIAMFDLNISLARPKACHPSVILLLISFSFDVSSINW